ncbi:MAG: hypothetical protein JKY65_19220 [Planctomycetes bacterium]|nr:hypothetical protein [Planctomycetota bacterium]
MGDADLGELERQAGDGPEAYQAWLRELVRVRHERVIAAEEFGEELGAWVLRFRERLVEETRDWGVEVPALESRTLLPPIRAALKPLAQGFEDVGYGTRKLGRLYEGGRANWEEIDDFEQLSQPLVPLAFVSRLEGEVTIGLGTSMSRKATPGTTFPALSPWRASLQNETLEKRLKRWRDETTGLRSFPEEAVLLWVGLLDLESEAESEVRAEPRTERNLDYASEKQVKFVRSLWRKKGLSEEEFLLHVRTTTGLRSAAKLEFLGREEASELIEVLLALPDRKRAKKASRSPSNSEGGFDPSAWGEPAQSPASRPEAAKKAKKAKPGAGKVQWEGEVLAVQPRITMTILGGEEQHGYKGYTLYLRGKVAGAAREFSVGIGKAAQAKHEFQAGSLASGAGAPAPPGEGIDLYKASKLSQEAGDAVPVPSGPSPPYRGLPRELPAYRAQGHRSLAPTALDSGPCAECIHGCLMPVDEHGERTLSAECYGPQDCPAFEPGQR